MAARRFYHVITPGDHFSPRTGSAVPTVVHGLAGALSEGEERHRVVVGTGTFPERYESADVVEYEPASPHRTDRYVDAALARLGLPRTASRRAYASALRGQDAWDPAVVVLHNAPQGVPLVDTDRHRAVLYVHNELFRTYGSREAARTLARVSAVVCVSEFLAQRTADTLPRHLRDRIHVVPNGVDAGFFRPARHDERHGTLRLVFVGRMKSEKGPDLAVKAVRLLPDVDVELTLVGSNGFDANDPLTAYERELRRAAEELGNRVDVRPFAPRDHVAQLMREADVVLVPSRWDEPFALTALEGLASGCVVIGAAAGGIPEAVGDAGILVPRDDASALAEEIRQLAEDRDELERRRAVGREFATRHTWKASWTVLRALASRLDEDEAPSAPLPPRRARS